MRRFWTNRKGNVGILFALAIIPVIGSVGAALDYSLANAHRTDVQKALDATALALSKIMPTSQATLNTVGNQHFSASMGNHTLSNLTLTITTETGILRLAAKGYYTPKIANVLGITTFEVGARAEAKWSLGKVEVALALDNTGSMASSNKINELKAATHNLLNVLQSAVREPGDAKVAIVPFNTVVNVGTTYKDENWLRWDLIDCNGSKSGTGCGNPPKNSWTGCVTDRNKDTNVNYDVLDTAPDGTTAKNYPAVQCGGSLVSMMPLTTNWDALHAKVDTMNASGNTNVTIGLVWAWHLLSQSSVFTQGTAYNTPNVTKFIILLTDGDNTENRWSTSESSINARTSAACENIKALKTPNNDPLIYIYTVRVINGNANLLRNCATEPSKYYDVQNAGQLSSVFNSIGAQIANLHLSK